MGILGFYPAERTKKCQAPIKSAQPFLAPELQTRNYMDITLFLIFSHRESAGVATLTFPWFYWHFPLSKKSSRRSKDAVVL